MVLVCARIQIFSQWLDSNLTPVISVLPMLGVILTVSENRYYTFCNNSSRNYIKAMFSTKTKFSREPQSNEISGKAPIQLLLSQIHSRDSKPSVLTYTQGLFRLKYLLFSSNINHGSYSLIYLFLINKAITFRRLYTDETKISLLFSRNVIQMRGFLVKKRNFLAFLWNTIRDAQIDHSFRRANMTQFPISF